MSTWAQPDIALQRRGMARKRMGAADASVRGDQADVTPLDHTTLIALFFNAAQAGDFRTQVSFADLDLSQHADARVMDERLEAAAKELVCSRPIQKRFVCWKPASTNRSRVALTQIQDGRDVISGEKMVRIRTATKTL